MVTEGPPGLPESLCSALLCFHAPPVLFSRVSKGFVWRPGASRKRFFFSFSPEPVSPESTPVPTPLHPRTRRGSGAGARRCGKPSALGDEPGQEGLPEDTDPTASPPLPSGIPLNPSPYSSEAWKGPSSGDCLGSPEDPPPPAPWMTADTVELGRVLDWPQQHCWASQTSASGAPRPIVLTCFCAFVCCLRLAPLPASDSRIPSLPEPCLASLPVSADGSSQASLCLLIPPS